MTQPSLQDDLQQNLNDLGEIQKAINDDMAMFEIVMESLRRCAPVNLEAEIAAEEVVTRLVEVRNHLRWIRLLHSGEA